MANLKIKVIKPTGVELQEDGEHIIVPGVDGDFGISAGHTTFITKIRPGVIQIFNQKKVDKYSIHDGFVTVEEDQVTIVTETFEAENQIDEERVIASNERAVKRLKDVNNKETDFRRAESSLKRSIARLETIQKAE